MQVTVCKTVHFVLALAALNAAVAFAVADPGGPGTLDRDFTDTIRPLVQQYCLGCHSSKHPKPWQQVIEQLSLGEMPPKGKPAPAAPERARLLTWVNLALDQAAAAHAGDPGPVPLRRLNNAEYTYTVRDLTDVNALDPAREFPADSAAGEGFMNTGSSLVMSPALLAKYLDAGKEIASHAVLLPDGFRFSSGGLSWKQTVPPSPLGRICGRIWRFSETCSLRSTHPRARRLIMEETLNFAPLACNNLRMSFLRGKRQTEPFPGVDEQEGTTVTVAIQAGKKRSRGGG